MEVKFETKGPVGTVILHRPEARNAVDAKTAAMLVAAFEAFANDERLAVAVLWGAGGTFCAGADLKAVAAGAPNELHADMRRPGPMGPTRMKLPKPVIAAVAGYAVAGGLELACWCDLRVVERSAVFGVFCRRFGVPLLDGGTQRLPRLIGMSRALDMILTGRPIGAAEALQMGLANRVVEDGTAREAAESLAAQIAAFPQFCMRSDREALYGGFDLPWEEAMALEFQLGMRVIASGETAAGAQRFRAGEGKHGSFPH